jgi:multidrug efflux pump subunit AcrB
MGSDFGGVNLSRWALQHKSFVFFLMFVCLASGIWSYVRLGRSEDPNFTAKIMFLKVIWPGGTIVETTNLITDKLEKKLVEVPHLDILRSQTKAGETTIYVTLKDGVQPQMVPDIWYQVRKKALDIWHTMPAGAQGPFFNDEFGDTFGIIYALTGDGFSQREMRDYAEKIRTQLFRVPEIKKIDLIGAQDEKIYIEFSPGVISNLGIDPNEIARAIHAPNQVLPAGQVVTDQELISVFVSGAYRTENDVRRINLHTARGFVRLGDIATIVRRPVDPPATLFRFNGAPAIGLAIAMSDDGDMIRLGKALKREVGKIEAKLPIGLELHSVADQAQVVSKAVGDFTQALFEAVAIVLAVGFLALGMRAGLVVAVSIPLVLAITFAVMSFWGIALQRISLGALIISLGLLVDDAMITVEMMIAKLEEGMDRVKAVSYAYSTTAFPMLTGTIVTAAGFIPVGFARSDAGEYSSTLFWVLLTALMASWIVAVLFSPLIGVYLLPKEMTRKHHEEGRFTKLFRRALLFFMRRRYTVIGVTVAVFVVSLWGATKLDQQFFPASDRPELVLGISLTQNASIYATQLNVDEIEKFLGADPDITHWSYYIGSGAPRFYLPLEPPLPNPFMAQAVIMTKDTLARERVRGRLLAFLDEKLPDVVARLAPLELGPPVGWPIKYRVGGEDWEQVRQLAFEVARVVSADAQTKNINFDWNEPSKVVRVEIDQDKANKVGLNPDVIARALNGVLTGLTVTQLRDATYLVDVVGRSHRAERLDLRTLRDLQIQVAGGTGGQSVPLSDLATLDYTDAQPVVWRRNQLPTITVQAELTGGQSDPVVGRLEPQMDVLRAKLPAGYSIEMGGIVEDSARAQASVLAVVPIMVIVMLTVLMVQLQSIQRLVLVISVAPLGLIGVVAIMLATGTPMGFISTLGVVALIGIIIRNSVILVDQIEANIASGQNAHDAVLDATIHRFRPIVLTAAAAVLGMLPIALDVFWGPMAYAMIGGLVVATLLTLVFLPALYIAWFRISEKPAALQPIPSPQTELLA